MAAAVFVEAHRGASLSAPENTIAAIHSAMGTADLTEFDVRISSDGSLVLMHDSTVDRTTNGTGAVSGMTLAQLKALDAGTWFSPAFSGEQVPTMTEAMNAAYTANIVPLVERKTGSAAAFDSEFNVQGFAASTFRVIAFDWNFLGDLDSLNPAYQLGALGSGTLSQGDIDSAITQGADFLDWNHSLIDQAAVDLVHANGLELHVYTVDDATRMLELIDFGIDGITTNNPALLRTLLPISSVPEPSTFLLLGFGLTALRLRRRRMACRQRARYDQ